MPTPRTSSTLIYQGGGVTLCREKYCYALQVGAGGPYYFSTANALRQGIKTYGRKASIKTLADLEEAAEKFIRREQARETTAVFRR